jgi:hypothetical protein
MSNEDDGWTDGACPFCKKNIRVNWEAAQLLHAMPMCERFKTLTADEFVQAVLDGQHLS